MKTPSMSKFKILVADDDDIILDLYEDVLSKDDIPEPSKSEMDAIGSELFKEESSKEPLIPNTMSFELTLCRRAEEAVEAVRKAVAQNQFFSVAFLDVRMPPGKNGIWAAEQIRNIDPYIEIVFVTGYSDIDPVQIYQKILPVHKVLYIQKPFHPVEINQFAIALSMKWQSEQELKKVHDSLEEQLKERTKEIAIVNKKLLEDIDNRKQTENDLKESRERLELALESSNACIWEWDFIKKKFYFDDRVLKMLGYESDEIPEGMDGAQLIHHPDDYRRMQKKINSHIGKETLIYDDEYRVRTKDGQWRWLHSCGKISKWDSDKIISGIAVDITERVNTKKEKDRLEKTLQQVQKMEAIGTLTGGIAHDFNNILTAVNGYMGIIKNHSSKDSKLSHYVEQVLQASNRATDLIRNMMAFSRQTEAKKIALDIGLIVKEALKLLRASIPSTIEIKSNVKTHLGKALVDPSQMHQVVMNLCTNAFQAMEKEGGILEISLDTETISHDFANIHMNIEQGQYLKLSVSDTGAGIGPDKIERIFEPYFTTKEVGEGTGLGLAMVHGIVKDHNGAITVDSKKGKGSTFIVYLPITEIEEKKSQSENVSPFILTGNEKILFVDDEKYLADVGKEMLEDYGYKVESVTSPNLALKIFKENYKKFDMVITDYTMPEMTGDKLAKKILEINPQIPVLMCTGFSKTLTPEIAKNTGIKKIILKPVNLDDFIKTVRIVLDER